MDTNIPNSIGKSIPKRYFVLNDGIANLSSMDIYEIRRQNLKRKSAEYKTKLAFSEALNLAPAYVSNMLNGKNIGEKIARKIEVSLSQPKYSLDTIGGSVAETKEDYGVFDLGSLSQALEAVEKVIADDSLNVPYSVKAYAVKKVYTGLQTGEISQQEVSTLLSTAMDFYK